MRQLVPICVVAIRSGLARSAPCGTILKREVCLAHADHEGRVGLLHLHDHGAAVRELDLVDDLDQAGAVGADGEELRQTLRQSSMFISRPLTGARAGT